MTSRTLTTRTSARRPRWAAFALAALTGGLLLSPLALPAADAHVRVVTDGTATAGGYGVLTFRVPNESDEASTTTVSVQLPQDTPFSSVRTRPVPGWRASLESADLPSPVEVGGAMLTEAPRVVTWTTRGDAAIGPAEYQDFALSVGPLPAPGEVLLPATQTYSDGEVVRWDEPVPASGEEPEHPAPVLVVAAAAEGGDASGGPAGAGVAAVALPSPDGT
ncbi:MAG: Conserved membrane protein in copper uptake, YcnI, partial [uncultured Friedmanniella sp.]